MAKDPNAVITFVDRHDQCYARYQRLDITAKSGSSGQAGTSRSVGVSLLQ